MQRSFASLLLTKETYWPRSTNPYTQENCVKTQHTTKIIPKLKTHPNSEQTITTHNTYRHIYVHLIQNIKAPIKDTINKYPTSIIFLNSYIDRGHPPSRMNPTRHHAIPNKTYLEWCTLKSNICLHPIRNRIDCSRQGHNYVLIRIINGFYINQLTTPTFNIIGMYMSSHLEDLHLIQNIKAPIKDTINKYPTSIIFLNSYIDRGHPPSRMNPTRHHAIPNKTYLEWCTLKSNICLHPIRNRIDCSRQGHNYVLIRIINGFYINQLTTPTFSIETTFTQNSHHCPICPDWGIKDIISKAHHQLSH